ncbi:hypothetical protein [Streptomyces sp. NPDC002671]
MVDLRTGLGDAADLQRGVAALGRGRDVDARERVVEAAHLQPGDPGPTRTPGTAPTAAALDALTKASPAGRPAEPEEIAGAALYLASEVATGAGHWLAAR